MLRINFYKPNIADLPLAFRASHDDKPNMSDKFSEVKSCFVHDSKKRNCGVICRNSKGHYVYKLPLPNTSIEINDLKKTGIKYFFCKMEAMGNFDNLLTKTDGIQTYLYDFDNPKNIKATLDLIDQADGDVGIFCFTGQGYSAALSYAYLCKKGSLDGEAQDIVLKGCSCKGFSRDNIYDLVQATPGIARIL